MTDNSRLNALLKKINNRKKDNKVETTKKGTYYCSILYDNNLVQDNKEINKDNKKQEYGKDKPIVSETIYCKYPN